MSNKIDVKSCQGHFLWWNGFSLSKLDAFLNTEGMQTTKGLLSVESQDEGLVRQ